MVEYINPDAGDAVANDCARQASAAFEYLIPYADDAVGNDDARDFRATKEGIVGDLQRVLRDINTSDVIVKISVRQVCTSTIQAHVS